MHQLLVVNVSHGLAARAQRAILGERDDVVCRRPQHLALRKCPPDPPVANQLGRLRSKHRLALIRRPVELLHFHAVALRDTGRTRLISQCL